MSPLPPDPYKALGVDKTADIAAIRSAHRKLVLKCHPDKVQDPKLKAEKTDEFQKIQQAYELLTDEDKLREYQEKLLKKQSSGTRVHVSTPRQSTRQRSEEFEFRSSPGGHTRVFTTTARAYDEDGGVYEIRTSKKSAFSSKSSSKRDSEKRRDKKEDEARRYRQEVSDAEREAAREARRADKERRDADRKLKEKIRDKQKRTGAEDKHSTSMRFTTAPLYDEPRDISPKPDRKKSSSRSKYGDRYDFFIPAEDVIYSRRPPMTTRTYSAMETAMERDAKSYINRSSSARAPPPAPTPPLKSKSSGYKKPDVQTDSEDYDSDVRRSRAQRRSSSGRSADRDTRRRSPDEVRDDPNVAAPSSAAQRAAPAFQRSNSSAASPGLASPPRDLPRTRRTTSSFENSPRIPHLGRAETFDVNDLPSYGRNRSRQVPQAPIDVSDDEEYDRYHSSSRRGSRRTPELPREMSSRSRREPSRLQRSESYDYSHYDDDGGYEMLYDKHGRPCPVRFTDRPTYVRRTSYMSPSMSRDGYASPAMSQYPIDGARYSRTSRDTGIYAQ